MTAGTKRARHRHTTTPAPSEAPTGYPVAAPT